MQVNKTKKEMTVEQALQMARDIIGDGTVFVCGTAAVISRGISMVTEINADGNPFLCPPTALIVVPPVGHSIEECYQAVSRCTGNFLESVKLLGQVNSLTRAKNLDSSSHNAMCQPERLSFAEAMY